VLQTLVASLVLSRLYYGNTTLAGLPYYLLVRLQSVVDDAAHVIFSALKYDHVMPLLLELHWLCAPQRIEYKLAVLVYRCLHSLALLYLAEGLLLWLTLIRNDACGQHRRLHSLFRWCVLPLVTAPPVWQPRGPGTACNLVSCRHHLCPRLGTSRHYFLPKAILTASTTHDKLFSSCAANSFFGLTLLGVLAVIVTLCHLNHLFDEWMNEWMNEYFGSEVEFWLEVLLFMSVVHWKATVINVNVWYTLCHVFQ